MSEWTAWSKPDATGTVYRVRYVIRPGLNGGKECEDMLQLKKGIWNCRNSNLKFLITRKADMVNQWLTSIFKINRTRSGLFIFFVNIDYLVILLKVLFMIILWCVHTNDNFLSNLRSQNFSLVFLFLTLGITRCCVLWEVLFVIYLKIVHGVFTISSVWFFSSFTKSI